MTPPPHHRRVGILGGGISGIALASQLGEDVDILEKRSRIGGLCGTIIENGFTFDAAGPHIMFSKNKDVLQRMVAVLGDNVHQKRRENRIYYKGRLVKYPFENDLASLPPEDNFECILGYLKNPRANDTPRNLAEWSYKTFGAGISEKYFIPYNRKIWNYDPEKISLDFVSRIPKPPLEDVLKSSIGIPTEGYLHQLHFYYPVEGGFEAMVDAFAERVKARIETNWEVASVRFADEHWHVMSTSGEERLYDELVSTIPIHDLLPIWEEAPREAVSAAARLRYNSLINVVVGLNEDPGHTYTALYVPDSDIVFHRL
ncbi:MAG TPA: FAD-dependent oxidoreductase, partial [Thermoanaerobaculia bacterium]